MATIEQCSAAVARLVERFASSDDARREHAHDRTVSCRVPDLDVTFHGRLHEGDLVDVTSSTGPDERTRSDLRLRVGSDDLVSLVDGDLALPEAWASGRLKIDASLRDLMRLRSLL